MSRLNLKLIREFSSSLGELCAILQAVLVASRKGIRKLIIFTDSLVACQLLDSNTTQNFCVARIHNLLVWNRFLSVRVVWTPSHIGIPYNETADRLAKEACVNGSLIDVDLSDCEALKIIESELFSKWYNEVLGLCQSSNSLFGRIFPSRAKKPWFDKFIFPAKIIKMFNRIIVGRTYDKVYLAKIRAIDSNLCFCGSVESFNHLIFECPAYDDIRKKYKIFDTHDNCLDLLIERDVNKWGELARFLEEANFDF